MKVYLKGIGLKQVVYQENGGEPTQGECVSNRGPYLEQRGIVRSSLEERRIRLPSLLYTYPIAPLEVEERLCDTMLYDAVSIPFA